MKSTAKIAGLLALCSLVVPPSVIAQLPPTPKEAARDTAGKPQLYVAQRSQDLGSVLEGDKVTVTWQLENRGGGDLVIDRTTASCGCTVVQLAEEEKTIRPGGTLALKAMFDSTARRDAQAKNITVFSNDPAEPELRLDFKAAIELLFELEPTGMVNLKAIRRGEASSRPLDILPGPGRKEVTIRSIEIQDDAPLTHQVEPLERSQGKGQRIRFAVAETAPLGQLNASANIKIVVDGTERERIVPLRGEVIADLAWLPRVVDATRQASLHGKRLAPVTISSPEKMEFDILEATAGPLLDVAVEPGKGKARTEYILNLTVRTDATPGPFGATLRIATSSLDQPLVEVPVFGLVAAPVEVEPRMVLLRDDGTPAGTRRRVRIMAATPGKLDIGTIVCDNPAVTAVMDEQAGAKYQHIGFLDVRLAGKLPAGRHTATLRVATSRAGAEQLEIPVTIEAGKHPG